MSVRNGEAAKQLIETRNKLGFMGDFLTYSPLVGFALNAITQQMPEAVRGVCGAMAKLSNGNGGYKLVWDRYGNRLTLNHHGHWKSEKVDDGGRVHHIMSRGRLVPLHDKSWIPAMMARDHSRRTPTAAVKFFVGLLKNNVDSPARIA